MLKHDWSDWHVLQNTLDTRPPPPLPPPLSLLSGYFSFVFFFSLPLIRFLFVTKTRPPQPLCMCVLGRYSRGCVFVWVLGDIMCKLWVNNSTFLAVYSHELTTTMPQTLTARQHRFQQSGKDVPLPTNPSLRTQHHRARAAPVLALSVKVVFTGINTSVASNKMRR